MALPKVSLDGSADSPGTFRVTAPAAPKSPAAPAEVTDVGAVEVSDLEASDRASQASGSKAPHATALDGVLGLLRYGVDQLADAAQKAGSHKGGFGDARPESWNQFRARVAARPWLPEDYDDGKFLIVAPTVFYYTVGAAGWCLGNATVWLCTHMLAFMTAFLLVAAVTVLWLAFG